MEEISCAGSYTAPGDYPEIRVEGRNEFFGHLSAWTSLLGNHPHRSGLERLVISRRRCVFSLFCCHGFSPFLSIILIASLSGKLCPSRYTRHQ